MAPGKRTRGAWPGFADRAGIGGAGAAAARRIKLNEGIEKDDYGLEILTETIADNI